MEIDKLEKLTAEFYRRSDVVKISKALLGKIIVTRIDGITTAARITETEAYNGIFDRASHAYNNRRTARTEVMYQNGGLAYVYLCYGVHYLFNVVTNKPDIPNAVLVRAAEPVYGEEWMHTRFDVEQKPYTITRGPGKVCRALGINKTHTGMDLRGDEIFIVSDGTSVKKEAIVTTPRIGVDYAGADALLPYRFYIKDNPFVSGKR